MAFLITVVAKAMGPSDIGNLLLILAPLVLLYRFARERFITSAGAFIFMSILFFVMRPLYVIRELDYELFYTLFLISVSDAMLYDAWAWAILGLCFFAFGAVFARQRFWPQSFNFKGSEEADHPLVSSNFVTFLIGCQIASIVVAELMTRGFFAPLEGTLGAYIYDFPMLMQAGHVFAVVCVWERYLRERTSNWRMMFCVVGLLFLFYTFEMRLLSSFRGFYITGIMIAGIAGLTRLYGKVRYRYVILPLIILLPIFRSLGENRYLDNEAVGGLLVQETWQLTSPASYWDFFDSRGDMNIYDSFAAALQSTPQHHPYVLSWLYIPVHLVPRKIWPDKPEAGLLVDHSFDRGAPYSPGIVGYFWLDGGYIWMLASMFVLGALLTFIDGRVLSMPDSYLKYCLYGIVVINAMYLTRFILYQWFYQTLYMAIPCFILQRMVDKRFGKSRQETTPEATPLPEVSQGYPRSSG